MNLEGAGPDQIEDEAVVRIRLGRQNPAFIAGN